MDKSHFRFCVFLALLTIPIFFIDKILLGGSSGGGWISLNFEGLLIGAWIIFLIAHIVVSSLAVSRFPGASHVAIHLGSAAATVVIVSLGAWVFFSASDAAENREYAKERERRKTLIPVITLNEWWYEPDEKDPREIHVNITVKEEGRFSGSINGYGIDSEGSEVIVIQAINVEQRQVVAGENFTHVFPMDTLHQGDTLKHVSMALYLFKDYPQKGSDITKIYENKVTTEDDGQYFYALIPKPREK